MIKRYSDPKWSWNIEEILAEGVVERVRIICLTRDG